MTLRVLTAALAVLALAAPPAARADDVLNPGTRLWVNPYSTTLAAAAKLTRRGPARRAAAARGDCANQYWPPADADERTS